MHKHARATALILPLLTAVLTACSSSGINTEPIGFAFVDAVSGQPIEGVAVVASRRASKEAFAQQADGARTGPSGRAILNLRPAPFIDVTASNPDYQPTNFEIQRSNQGLSLNGIPAALADPLNNEQAQDFNNALAWKVALVPDPPLEIQLIIPDDFRGLVRVIYPPDLSPSTPAPGIMGPRDTPKTTIERDRFVTVSITQDGRAFLPSTWLLNTPHIFSAVRTDNTPIPGPQGAMARGATERDTRLRGGIDLLRADFFVIGSRREYQQALAREFRLDR